MTKLSIITVNKNDAKGLKRTLQSIWEEQTFRNFEHIVIDGASTDNSIGIIKAYESKLSYWISEPDKGIYNAMNKGIAQAQGDYLIFLNSGDWFENDVLAKAFAIDFKEDIAYGNFHIYYSTSRIRTITFPEKLTIPYLFHDSLGHQSTFIKKELFKNIRYEEKYSIVSDWAFFVLQIIQNNCTTKHLDIAISYFNAYGVSSTPESVRIIAQEQEDFLQKNFPKILIEHIKDYEEQEKSLKAQKRALDILSKHRTQRLIESEWIQKSARKYIKILFLLQKLLGK